MKQNILRAVAVIVLLCIAGGSIVGCNTVEKTEEVTAVSATAESLSETTVETEETEYNPNGLEGYTYVTGYGNIWLYVLTKTMNSGDCGFALIYNDTDGNERRIDFTGSGYAVMPDSAFAPIIRTTYATGDYGIAVMFTTGSGTGIHTEELRLFDGGSGKEIPVKPAVEYLDGTLKILSDSEKWTFDSGSEIFTVGKAQFADYTAEDIFDKPDYSRSFYYHVTEDRIYCDMSLCCAGQLTGYGNEYLRVSCEYKDGSLACSNVALRYMDGGCIDTDTESMADYLDDRGDCDSFILRLTDVNDALLEVSLDESGIPFAYSLTVGERTLNFDLPVQLYGNFNIDLFAAGGMTVFDKLYYGVGDTYIFHSGGIYEIRDTLTQDGYTTYLYAENGVMRYCRQSTKINQANLVQTGFDVIVHAIESRDDYFRSYGEFTIDAAGNADYSCDTLQTLSDVYDLDAEYEKWKSAYGGDYPDTLDQLIEQNNRTVPGNAEQAMINYLYAKLLPEGADEILYCGRIFANTVYLCLFRTSPKSVCVYTINQDYTEFNRVDVTIPADKEYDSVEAVWASGGGGSGDSQFWIELEKDGTYEYLRFDNFAYTGIDDWLIYSYDGDVPDNELIGAYESGAPIKFPNLNASY